MFLGIVQYCRAFVLLTLFLLRSHPFWLFLGFCSVESALIRYFWRNKLLIRNFRCELLRDRMPYYSSNNSLNRAESMKAYDKNAI